MLPNRLPPFTGTPPVPGTGWFDREGREYPVAGRYGSDAKRKAGKPFASVQYPCNRCGGGGGSDKWAYTGWTCYDCGGSGRGKLHDTPLYTPAELAVLNERRDKMRDKKTALRQIKAASDLAERLHREGERAADLEAQPFYQEFKTLMGTFTEQRPAPSFLADMWRRIKGEDLTPNQETAVRKFIATAKDREFKKEHSTHLGTKGDRIELRAKVIGCKPIYPTVNSYNQDILYVIKFETPDRQTLTWFTSRSYTVGVELTGKATIVDHTEWNGVKETKIKNFRAAGEVDGKQAELF